jgi:heat shock protein HslJ
MKILVFSFCVLLFSCKTKIDATSQNIHRKWMLTALNDFQKEQLIAKNCFLDLTNVTTANAYMGCNTIGFVYSYDDKGKFEFKESRTTHMYCEDHAIESQFLNEVSTVSSYKVEGHKLTLITESNKKITFVAEDWD